MATVATHLTVANRSSSRADVPPLENGDSLTSQEFRRRWEAMPELKYAELIEGLVFMAAAVRHRQHGRPYRMLIAWLDRYITKTPGLDGGGNATIGLDDLNDPQPDGYCFLPSGVGGRAIITPDGYIKGPPELLIEISASTASLDLNLKFEAYQRNGVREYLVWRVLEKAIDWFVLEGGQYARLTVEENVYKSRIFPGLWLNAEALLRRDAKALYATLDLGMATAEYQSFADKVKAFAPQNDE